ncbi:hypothetical protein BJ994_002205 [Arthrobacter pigmenti]|uniref:Putative Flp pilus-assembly TadG-like N-terminal domain-containing protein n=1 Tax=Arthrobacter pigmenti TaxID=271432 RepID=A0A846RPW7_9MICC|nr:Tad domain-containing protein [Arthrobacter pigmenti]NJC23129.1 hypothetical protein [Arthrobacter pigmenti]
MRRLTQKDGEQGAVSVLAAFLMVVLLAFAALAVDVGMLYAEKAQLQNGADATALGVAQACASTPPTADCVESVAASSLAKQLADGNALDGRSNPQVVDIDPSLRTVSVETGALENGATANRVSLFFANALGIAEADVTASAYAAWGSPVSGPAPFPVVFSECELSDGSEMQVVEFRKKGNNTSGCPSGPPGGFSHLDSVAGKCEAMITVSAGASGSNVGNKGVDSTCTALLTFWRSEIEAGRAPIGLFPIYTSITDSGNNATYALKGFAAFEVYGWKLKQTGNPSFPDAFRHNHYSGSKCNTTQCIGIIGKFIKMVSLEDGYKLGPVDPSLKTTVVKLTLEEEEIP